MRGRGRAPRQVAPERRGVREEVGHLDDVHGYQPLEPPLADVVLVILPVSLALFFRVTRAVEQGDALVVVLSFPTPIRGGEAVVAVARREMLGTVLGVVPRVGASGPRYWVLALGYRPWVRTCRVI